MKTKTNIILGALSVLVIGAFWHMGHGISLFAHVDRGDSSSGSHSRQDISRAVSFARNKFRDFEGCIMTDLSYNEELTQQEKKQYDRDFKHYTGDPEKWVDDVIVLESTFTTSKVFSECTFNGCTQRGWKWIITHTPENGWELKDGAWGYA